LALTGCDENPLKPDFKKGDCIVYEDLEPWEKGDSLTMYKVEEVGKQQYRVSYISPRLMKGHLTERYIRTTDRIFEKTECPNEQ
jgi:hypothetical protein